jgi:hypothetical protein
MIVKNLLEETSNKKIFSVTFVKKDGSIRKMTAMRGVRKGVKGVGHSFDPSEKNLLTVYDMRIGAFRFVNLNDVLLFKANKKTFTK